MRYEDFYLQLDALPQGEFRVQVLSSPAGEGSAPLNLDLDVETVMDSLRSQGLATRSAGLQELRHFRGEDLDHRPLPPTAQEMGERFFNSLFSGRVRSLLDQSLGKLQGQSQASCGLRIKLKLDPADPRLSVLADLPWELLCSADTKDFLALSRRFPVVRYLDVPRPSEPIPFSPPLRILGVTACPRELRSLDLGKEHDRLEKINRDHDGIDVRFLEHASISDLREVLLEGNYHVLHFMGHGDFDPRSGEGLLFFERPDGSAEIVSGRALATTIKDFHDLGLVVLNACNTAKAASRTGHNAFRGVANALVLGGRPAVVAMQFPISDLAAIAFSSTFYRRLARGEAVETALTEGRQAIHSARPEALEWAIPVLFQRVSDGNVFVLRSEDELPQPVTPLRQPMPAPSPAAPVLATPSENAKTPRWSSRQMAGVGGAVAAVVVSAVVIANQISTGSTPSTRDGAKSPAITGEGQNQPENKPASTSPDSQQPASQQGARSREKVSGPSSAAESRRLDAPAPAKPRNIPQSDPPASGNSVPSPGTPLSPATTTDLGLLSAQFASLESQDGSIRAWVTFTNAGEQPLKVTLDDSGCFLSGGGGRYDVLDSSLPSRGSGYELAVPGLGSVKSYLVFSRVPLQVRELTLFLATTGGRLKVAHATRPLDGVP